MRPHAGEARARRQVGAPFEDGRVGPRGGQRQALGGTLRSSMGLARLLVVGPHGGDGLVVFRADEVGDDADGAAGIEHVHRLALGIARVDLDGRVNLRRRRAADEERHVKILPLHLARDMHHLVERGGDEAGEADDVDLVLLRLRQNLLRRDHHAEVDHLVAVAGQDDADDVLADVVHVALHRRHQDLGVGLLDPAGGEERGLLLLHEGFEIGHGALHHAGRLHDLRQEHLAGAEEVADDVHAGHERAFDDVERAAELGSARPRHPPPHSPRCR